MDEFLKLQKACEKYKNDIDDIKRKLTKIEKKKNDVDPDVFDKIFNEYEGKLKEIEKKYKEDLSNLENLKKELNEKMLNNEEESKKLKKEIDEIELRYLAEEFGEDEYKKRMGDKKEKYQSLLQEIETIKATLGGENVVPGVVGVEEEDKKVTEEATPEPAKEESRKEQPEV
ncbi:MAG TPA: hypothetical protein ENJ25_00395, partial [Firmicutes bacterium]|nr:hypothetical protein [Bacillota bacterium]